MLGFKNHLTHVIGSRVAAPGCQGVLPGVQLACGYRLTFIYRPKTNVACEYNAAMAAPMPQPLCVRAQSGDQE